jgi:hypothetical protein
MDKSKSVIFLFLDSVKNILKYSKTYSLVEKKTIEVNSLEAKIYPEVKCRELSINLLEG